MTKSIKKLSQGYQVQNTEVEFIKENKKVKKKENTLSIKKKRRKQYLYSRKERKKHAFEPEKRKKTRI